MSFKIGGVNYPTLWFGNDDTGPVFLIVREVADSWGLVDLDYLRDTMQEVANGDLDMRDAYDELYIRMPGRPGITQCTATIGGTAEKAELVILSTFSASELCRCEL